MDQHRPHLGPTQARSRAQVAPLLETEGVQWETKKTRPLGRRTHHAAKGKKKGAISETRGGKTLKRRTHHPTKGSKQGCNGRQKGARRGTRGGTMGDKRGHDPREGRHTIQERAPGASLQLIQGPGGLGADEAPQ